MHSKLAHSLLLLCIVRLGYAAPAPSVDKRRETTPQILDLEQELKKQAGEDKKFYPSANALPIPQIDGLDDNPVLPPGTDLTHNPELNAAVDPGIPELPAEGEEEEEEEDNNVQEDDEELQQQDEEEEEEELLEQEDERKAFLDGLLESLQRNPELLNQMMRDGDLDEALVGRGPGELDDSARPVYEDQADAIEAEMLSAMRGDRTKDARPVPIDEEMADDVSQNTGATAGESVNDLLEDELEDEGDEEEEEGEEYGNEEEDGDEDDEEEEDYYEELLKQIAEKRPELFRENMQEYRGDQDAHVVAKKRGYAPPVDREEEEEEEEELNMLQGAGPDFMTPEDGNNMAGDLDALKSYWASRMGQDPIDRHIRAAKDNRMYM